MNARNRKPLNFGVLGCANIAKGFVRDASASPAVRFVAVASRDAAKADAFARPFNIPRAHDSYEALLADADVQAVYIPLPNSLHAQWAVRAAQAGKHVLCEKPLALNRAEAQAMFAAARDAGVMLLEAYPYWFQPQTGAMLQLLNQGAIGAVQAVQASFGFCMPNPVGNIRLNPQLGGGALLDAGSYAMSLIRLAMGSAPQRVQAHSRWADSGVDMATSASLLWADGRVAQLFCAMDVGYHRRATVIGAQGTLETEYLNHTSTQNGGHPLGWLPSQMRVRRGPGFSAAYEDIASPSGSGFRFAAEAFAQVVARQDFAAIERAAQASIDIAATLEAIAASARSGRMTDLPLA